MIVIAPHNLEKLRFVWCYCAVFIAALAAFFVPGFFESAMAQVNPTGSGFSCQNGQPVGDLFAAAPCGGGPGEGFIFSSFVCEFEDIIRETMKQVYCAIVQEAIEPVQAALTLMITITGAAFLMGVTPFTAKELMIILGKFTLVLAFALQAEYMIGIGYNLFMAVTKDGISIVLGHLFAGGGAGGGGGGFATSNDVYRFFDQVAQGFLDNVAQDTGEGSQCNNAIFALVTLTIATVPPLFAVASYFAAKLLWVILRAVFGYCQGILGVTFLVTLAPIFVSFALFKPTRALFDKWVQYLISFSFQMVIVFAFLGMAFSIMMEMADGLGDYTALVKPYKVDSRDQSLAMPWDVCGVCEMDKVRPGEKPRCASDRVIPPGEMVANEDFLHFATVKTIGMVIMFYLLDIMMDFVPQMARHLAGPRYAGQLGGGDTGGVEQVDMSIPGEKSMRQALGKGGQAFNHAATKHTLDGVQRAGPAIARELGRSAQEEMGNIGRGVTAGGVYTALRGASGGKVPGPGGVPIHKGREPLGTIRGITTTTSADPRLTQVAGFVENQLKPGMSYERALQVIDDALANVQGVSRDDVIQLLLAHGKNDASKIFRA